MEPPTPSWATSWAPTEEKSYVIDPDGEVIFLLEDANAPFAVGDEEKISKPTPEEACQKAS